jgi:hypothetical protein
MRNLLCSRTFAGTVDAIVNKTGMSFDPLRLIFWEEMLGVRLKKTTYKQIKIIYKLHKHILNT